MRKIRRLKLEALESCRYRGHTMGRFGHIDGWRSSTISTCSVCGAWVTVIAHPLPNQIDIGGEAVALDCPVDPKYL